MKNTNQNIGIFSIIIVYCFAIIAVVFLPKGHIHIGSNDHESEYNITDISSTFLNDSLTLELSFNNQNSSSFPVFKKSVNNVWAKIEDSRYFFKNKLFSFSKFSGTIVIRFWKTDIIFPFHYFW